MAQPPESRAASPPPARRSPADPAWIRYAPLSLSGPRPVGVVGGFLAQRSPRGSASTRSRRPARDIADALEAAPLGAPLASVCSSAARRRLLSTLGYVLAFWNFRLTRHAGGTLHVARGLLTSRATTSRSAGCEASSSRAPAAAGGGRRPRRGHRDRAAAARARSAAARCSCRPRRAPRRDGSPPPCSAPASRSGRARPSRPGARARATRARWAPLSSVAAAERRPVCSSNWPDLDLGGRARRRCPCPVALAADRRAQPRPRADRRPSRHPLGLARAPPQRARPRGGDRHHGAALVVPAPRRPRHADRNDRRRRPGLCRARRQGRRGPARRPGDGSRAARAVRRRPPPASARRPCRAASRKTD